MSDILETINNYVNRFHEQLSEIDSISNYKEREDGIASFLHDRGLSTMYPSELHVAVLEVHRCYGGPEEGGWYYDASTPIEHVVIDVDWERPNVGCVTWDIPLAHLEAIYKVSEIWKERYDIGGKETRSNVRGEPDYYIDVDFLEQRDEPQEKPRYE